MKRRYEMKKRAVRDAGPYYIVLANGSPMRGADALTTCAVGNGLDHSIFIAQIYSGTVKTVPYDAI